MILIRLTVLFCSHARELAILEEKETFVVYFWEKKKSIPSRYRVTNTKAVVHYLPSGFRRTRSRMSFLSTLLFPFLSYSLLNSGLLIFTEIRAVHSVELNPAMGIVIAGLSQFHGRTCMCESACGCALLIRDSLLRTMYFPICYTFIYIRALIYHIRLIDGTYKAIDLARLPTFKIYSILKEQFGRILLEFEDFYKFHVL